MNSFEEINNIKSINIIKAKTTSILFTVAIPTYNRADLLKEAIDSALNQENYSDFNILIVDNNPKRNDDTEKLLLGYDDPRITYYKNTTNLGMVGNWNRLYFLANSKYVIMLHDDDMLYPDFFIRLTMLLDKTKEQYAAYFPSYNIFNMLYNNDIPLRSETNLKYKDIHHSDFIYGNVIGPPVGMCIKKEVFLELGGFSEHYYPSIDYEFYVKIAASYKICRMTNYPTAIYRIGENESCKTDTILTFVQVDKRIKETIISDAPFFMKYIYRLYFRSFSYYYLERMKKLYKNRDLQMDKPSCIDIIIYNIMSLIKRITLIFR